MAKISLSPSPQRQILIRVWKPVWPTGPTKSPRRGSSTRPSSQTLYYCCLWGRGVGWISGPSFFLNLSGAPRSGQSPIHLHLTGFSPSQLPFPQGKKISKRDKPCVREQNHGITPYFHSRRKLWENKSFRPSWPLSRAVLASPLTEKQTKGFFFLFGGGEEDFCKSSHKYQIPECRSLSYFCFIASFKKCEEASQISTGWLYCHYHNLLVDFLPQNGPKTIWRQNQRRTGHGFTISSRFFLSIESSKKETDIRAPRVALQRFHRYENPTIETGRKTTFRINVWSLFQSEGETVGKKWRGR